MKGKRDETILAVLVVFEMIWAAVMFNSPTRAAEVPAEDPIVITKTVSENMPEEQPEVKETVENVTIYIDVLPKLETELDEADKILLAKVVHREARGEDFIGKRLVADTILNRIDSDSFPDTVSSVITNVYARPALSYTEDDMLAVEMELLQRLDDEVIYFRTGQFHSCGEPMYQHGAHYFSGEGR